jgi:hypothetical protein
MHIFSIEHTHTTVRLVERLQMHTEDDTRTDLDTHIYKCLHREAMKIYYVHTASVSQTCCIYFVHMSAADRSRSRSPTGRIGRAFLARVLTPRFNYRAYLATWLRHLLSRPVILEGHVYSELLKKDDYLPGKLWLRLVLKTRSRW